MPRSSLERLCALRALQADAERQVLEREATRLRQVMEAQVQANTAAAEHRRSAHDTLLEAERVASTAHLLEASHKLSGLAHLRELESKLQEMLERQRRLYAAALRARREMEVLCDAERLALSKVEQKREQAELDGWFLLRRQTTAASSYEPAENAATKLLREF